MEEYEKLENLRYRSFNKISVEDKILIKKPTNKQGEDLAKKKEIGTKRLKNSI